ncbi:MAG: ABC transporter ATP-binding protein [Clostridiaceae bacterium]|jgi:ABC-2 type transport system ATP-binding protein|nr:ABC transporter ATP-binding protein [Clostridiaceae bacterium]
MAVIQTRGLTKYYGKSRGIENLDLTVEEGEFFGFIGPNGAGKSTTIRTLLNFIYPSSGEAAIFGMDCVKESMRIKAVTGYVPGEINYYREIKVRDLLNYAANFYENIDRAYLERLCQEFEIEVDKKIGSLSLGNKKKVAIAQALMHKPRLLILDEPANGLDPLIQSRLFSRLKEINQEGTTVFLSSHNLSEVQRHCHRVGFIREGRIIKVTRVDELLGNASRRVIVKSKDDLTTALHELGIKKVEAADDTYVFVFDGHIDRLLKTLVRYSIDDLRIEEASLEEQFMHFYEREEEES